MRGIERILGPGLRTSFRWCRPRSGPSGTICVDLYGVTGVAVAGDAAVGDARCVMELGAPAPEDRLQPDAEAETAMEPSRELARR